MFDGTKLPAPHGILSLVDIYSHYIPHICQTKYSDEGPEFEKYSSADLGRDVHGWYFLIVEYIIIYTQVVGSLLTLGGVYIIHYAHQQKTAALS